MLQFIFFSAKRGRMTVCRLNVHLRCERRRWEIQILICFFLSPSRATVALSRALFYLAEQSAGVWPPQSIFSMPACLQLVSSNLWLLVVLRGVSIKHRLFSYSQNVKLQLTLEMHSHRMSSLSLAIQKPTIHPYLLSTVIKIILTTLHHRIVHN